MLSGRDAAPGLPGGRPPAPRWHWPYLLFGLALALRLFGLGFESFWFDEIWAVRQARLPLPQLLTDLRQSDVHPPLWPVLLHLWLPVGEQEWLVRVPSALFGALAVLGVSLFLRRVTTDGVAFRASLLLALSSYAVEFSQEARAYALLLALSAFSLLAAVEWALAPGSRRWPAIWTLLAAAMLYTHVFGAFVLLAQGLYVLVSVPALRRAIVLTGALALLLYAPWIPSQIAQVTRVQEDFWIAPMRWYEPAIWLWHWSGYSVPVTAGLALGSVAGWLVTPSALRRLYGWLALCVVGLPGLLSLVGQPIFQPKYAIVMLIPLLGLSAAALARLPRVAEVLVYAGLSAQLILGVYQYTGKEQYRELARYGDAQAREGATLLTTLEMWPYVAFYSQMPVLTTRSASEPGDVVLLLAHPPRSEALEAAYRSVCAPLAEVALIGTRAVGFRCPIRMIVPNKAP